MLCFSRMQEMTTPLPHQPGLLPGGVIQLVPSMLAQSQGAWAAIEETSSGNRQVASRIIGNRKDYGSHDYSA